MVIEGGLFVEGDSFSSGSGSRAHVCVLHLQHGSTVPAIRKNTTAATGSGAEEINIWKHFLKLQMSLFDQSKLESTTHPPPVEGGKV